MPGIVRTGAFPMILAIDAAQKQLGVRGAVGEIGVFYGKLLILLGLLAESDEGIVAIDIFGEARIKDAFLNNLRRHLGSVDRCAVLHCDSSTLCGADIVAAAGGRLRLISVDGDHSARATEHDLMLARDSLAEGGVILLDDYFQEFCPGVSEATGRLFFREALGELVPFAIGGNKVYFCGRSFAPEFQAAMRAERFPASASEERFFGAPVLCFNFAPHNFFGFNVSQRWVNTPIWRAVREHPIGHYIRFRLRRL